MWYTNISDNDVVLSAVLSSLFGCVMSFRMMLIFIRQSLADVLTHTHKHLFALGTQFYSHQHLSNPWVIPVSHKPPIIGTHRKDGNQAHRHVTLQQHLSGVKELEIIYDENRWWVKWMRAEVKHTQFCHHSSRVNTFRNDLNYDTRGDWQLYTMSCALLKWWIDGV